MLQIRECSAEIPIPTDRIIDESVLNERQLEFLRYLKNAAHFDSELDLTHELAIRRWWIDYIIIEGEHERLSDNEAVFAVYSWDINEDSILSYLLISGDERDLDILFSGLE